MDGRSRLFKRQSNSCFYEDVSDFSDSEKDSNFSLQVHVAQSLERNHFSEDQLSLGCNDRKRLLEECKLKLMASNRNFTKRGIYANSAPLYPENCSSNVTSRSFETVRNPCHSNARKMGDNQRRTTFIANNRDMEVGDTLRQVYTTAKTSNIRDLLKCQNPNRHNEDPKQPCLCKHCGMTDVLIESQKRLMPEECYDSTPEEPKSTDSLKSNNMNKRILNDLLKRVKTLELALYNQEEKYVTKEYLKIVVDKIISYITPKQERTVKPHHCVRSPLKMNAATQCNKLQKDTIKIASSRRKQYEQFIGSALSTPKEEQNQSKASDDEESDLQEDDEEHVYQNNDIFWRWGDETIKPGVDLKDRIIKLMNDSTVKTNPHRPSKRDVAVVASSEKTLYLYGSENQDNTVSDMKPSKNFKQILDVMSEKIYTDYIAGHKPEKSNLHQRNEKKALDDGMFKMNMHNARKKTEMLRKASEQNDDDSITKKSFDLKKVTSQKSIAKKSLIPKYRKNYTNAQSADMNTADNSKFRVTSMSSKVDKQKDSCTCFKVQQYFKDSNGFIKKAGNYLYFRAFQEAMEIYVA